MWLNVRIERETAARWDQSARNALTTLEGATEGNAGCAMGYTFMCWGTSFSSASRVSPLWRKLRFGYVVAVWRVHIG